VSVDETDMPKVVDLCRQLEAMGCVVVVFTPEELRGANPSHVEDRLIELGWDVIDVLAEDIDEDWYRDIK
jgi:hypothetical protein